MTSDQQTRRELPPLGDVLVAVAVLVMVIALLAGGGSPRSVPAGLIGASTPVSWALPLFRLIADGAAIVCCGGLSAVWLLLANTHVQVCRDAAVAAGIWCVATAGGLITTAAVVLGGPLTKLPERAAEAAALPQIRALAVTVVATALLTLMLSGCRTVRTARIAVFITAVAVVVPLLTGHAAAEQRATIATASLAIHVLAASAWVGGLGALVRYARASDPLVAVTRYSRLALVAAVSTGFSGLLTAAIHLIREGFVSGYGALVLAKVLAFAVLVGIGGWHRQKTLPLLAAGNSQPFWRLAIVELVLMAATIGLAVALSRTP